MCMYFDQRCWGRHFGPNTERDLPIEDVTDHDHADQGRRGLGALSENEGFGKEGLRRGAKSPARANRRTAGTSQSTNEDSRWTHGGLRLAA